MGKVWNSEKEVVPRGNISRLPAKASDWRGYDLSVCVIVDVGGGGSGDEDSSTSAGKGYRCPCKGHFE